MRVKWNRNLDGIRPLITVPETDVISNGKLQDIDNCEKKSFTDFNENSTENSENIANNGIDSVRAQACESPCPSSASITSKRSDKSKARISSLFGLFKVKDKVNDNNSEDCVSNFSELSGTTVPSLLSESVSKSRKSSYGSRDSILSIHEKIGFETDSRRRRRANSLLARSSLRRSWQQLNANNRPIGPNYIITRERYSNHYLNKSSEQPLLISSQICYMRPKSELSPEVSSKVESEEGSQTETNITGSESQPIPRSDHKKDNKELENNSIFVMQTVVQTVECKSNCISESDLFEKSGGCDQSDGCDGVDNKVQSVVNSLDSEYISLNNSKMIFDPKNSFKYIKNEPKLESDKTNPNIFNDISKNGVQLKEICVNNENNGIHIVIKSDETTQTTPQLSSKRKSDKTIDSNIKTSLNSDDSKQNCELNFRQTVEQTLESPDPLINCESPITSINDSINGCADNIIKVKVKKTHLPESEAVCFSTQIVSSPSTVSTPDTDNESNNDRAVVLTFINDEPMTSRDRFVDNENIKSDIFVKSTPIQGILRVRSRDSNSEDSSNGLTKTNELNVKSQKKVHFADNCLHNRNASHGRSRTVKGRHYSALGSIRTIRTNL